MMNKASLLRWSKRERNLRMIDLPNPSTPSRALILAAFAAVYIIWGSTYLAIRFAVEVLPPFLMVGTRFLIAGFILYLWARIGGASRPDLSQWKSAAIVGLLMLVLANGLISWSEQWIPSGLAALLVATVPFWMVMLDWMRPRGEAPSSRVVLGLIIGFVGVALLFQPWRSTRRRQVRSPGCCHGYGCSLFLGHRVSLFRACKTPFLSNTLDGNGNAFWRDDRSGGRNAPWGTRQY